MNINYNFILKLRFGKCLIKLPKKLIKSKENAKVNSFLSSPLTFFRTITKFDNIIQNEITSLHLQ